MRHPWLQAGSVTRARNYLGTWQGSITRRLTELLRAAQGGRITAGQALEQDPASLVTEYRQAIKGVVGSAVDSMTVLPGLTYEMEDSSRTVPSTRAPGGRSASKTVALARFTSVLARPSQGPQAVVPSDSALLQDSGIGYLVTTFI